MSLRPEQDLTDEQITVKKMVNHLTEYFGVTHIDHHVTVRWTDEEGSHQVSMVVADVSTPSDMKELTRQSEAWQRLYKKYPGLEADAFKAETGETPQ